MARRARTTVLAAALVALAIAGCGGGADPETRVEAAGPGDERLADRIEAELDVYDQGFDLESMPDDQADQIAPVVDNLPQAAGGIGILRVDSGRVEAVTDFPDDHEGEITGRLICGAIERAGGRDGIVLGDDESVLAECMPDDRNFP